jgi:hypothetical protein
MITIKKILPFALLLAPAVRAQTYSIDWLKVAGGGGTSAGTNGGSVYSITGTIGQPDASGAMNGGSYSLSGGFWSLIYVLPAAGTPNLSITQSGKSVVVSWPNTGNYILQQSSNLAAAPGWATSSYSVTTNSPSGTNSITVTPATGVLFFRLVNP